MKTLVIVNPCASKYGRRGQDAVTRSLSSVSDLEVVHTRHRGHGVEVARAAAMERRFDTVVAMGGDGTINEIVNGLLSCEPSVRPQLGAIPAGATNVFLRSLGFPNDVAAAANVLKASIEAKGLRRINVGCVNGRYFVFSAGI